MKKLSLFALAAAGLLVGACSEKDEVVSEQQNQLGLVAGEHSWIAVGVSMPGDAITRANEDLTDGDASEYTVKSGTLYLFKGATEDAAVMFGSYPITATFDLEADDNVPDGNSLGSEANGFGEITSTSTKIVQEIENPSLGVNDKLWAYVILNDQNSSKEQLAALGLIATKGTTTGADFKDEALKVIGIDDESKGYGSIGDNGLVMTSVPIALKAGGLTDPTGADIVTFAEIDKSAIYKTKAEAEATGAQMTCIYVERAAVKVEVKLDADFGIQLDGEETVTKIDASKVKWALGNVNHGASDGKGYYNTRHFDTSWLGYWNQAVAASTKYLQYRMVGRTAFFDADHTPIPAYRTYFGKDLNYVGEGTLGVNGLDASEGLKGAKLADTDYTLETSTTGTVTYTYENTFDEKSQIYKNTTYVGVKVDINSGADFYTVADQPNTKLAAVADVATVVKNRLRSAIGEAVVNIQKAIDDDLKSSSRTISVDVTSVTFDMETTVTFGTSTADQIAKGEQAIEVSLALSNVKTNGATPSSDDKNAIDALAAGYLDISSAVADLPKVYKYTGGISYYSARIQHFGDIETPWDAETEAFNNYADETAPKICVYPATPNAVTVSGTTYNFGDDRASAWLGRWGIVRNNWYSITLKKIEGIGSPVPEDFSGEAGYTPDDNPEPKYYIAAEVHILPWVKRTQEVTF